MKLETSTRLPEESTCRFVTTVDGKLLGAIDTARDMLEANWISIRGVPKNATDLDKWLAVKTPSGWAKAFDTREEALAVFEGRRR